MQVSRLFEFHKALADLTRIRILALLAGGPLHGQALAGKLGVTPPTITHHMAKLREIGLISEHRDKNTIYFSLKKDVLAEHALAIVDLVNKPEALAEEEEEKQRLGVLKNFFDTDGRLKSIPAQRKKRLLVFEHLLRGLKTGRTYTEIEINDYIKKYHEDYATIRREFIANHYMYRENGIYELNPPEMWAKSE
ncbi:metalloregulator ArsR/SmtB family transcription factor [Tumebacillus sp. ITR2]|uniref:Metalloregulator ArsR/SmtB family transcription factor n=1 Tax=Tumebacillus amylolyticus TaxID=2801339 RepID=A0ABS1JG35_9BACL|nr:metalloregulator ArsR/SmtB family transcription factor [Tumebacillus amylolyticus]MBL0389202.1 metalloregulator ArsR/SmtB family transcription factor [Tumebacillus amylolyticus]